MGGGLRGPLQTGRACLTRVCIRIAAPCGRSGGAIVTKCPQNAHICVTSGGIEAGEHNNGRATGPERRNPSLRQLAALWFTAVLFFVLAWVQDVLSLTLLAIVVALYTVAVGYWVRVALRDRRNRR